MNNNIKHTGIRYLIYYIVTEIKFIIFIDIIYI